MEHLTGIDWTMQTGRGSVDGTDTPISLLIYRDQHLLKKLRIESKPSAELDRGEVDFYEWTYVDPSGIGTQVSGVGIPDSLDFPQGISGHLRVQLVARGDDRWKKVHIDSVVHTGWLTSNGNFEPTAWVEKTRTFSFPQDVILSTDAAEGYQSWVLRYL